MTKAYKPCGAHFTGSISLQNAEDVFRTLGPLLGDRVRRLPDGESEAPRSWWIGCQMPLFYANPLFEALPADPEAYAPMETMKLRRPVAPNEISFPALGYAEAAKQSYALFSELKRKGIIDKRCRFQVSLPAPLDVVVGIVCPVDRAVVEKAYEPRMIDEVREICAAIPHDDLAIQWDAPMEVCAIERPDVTPLWFGTTPSETKRGIVERFCRISEGIPSEVELGFHLCYGNFGHKHFVEPRDLRVAVDIANETCHAMTRLVQFIHMPVPRERNDDAYFAPLRNLTLRSETMVYLGLLHGEDGVQGARARIDAAHRHLPKFGIATECGISNLPRETVDLLLRLHAELASPAW